MKKFIALAALVTLTTARDLSGGVNHARFAKRQTTTTSSSTSTASISSSSAASSTGSVTTSVSASGTAAASGSSAATGTTTSASTPPAITTTYPATYIPPISSIISGQAPESTLPLTTTYAPGATPSIAGAPPIPSFAFSAADWPVMDKHPDPTSEQVQEWMKELDGFDIPDLAVTTGECDTSPQQAANASALGWWTCGGYTRSTDVVACPDKLTWGMSFDDGPGQYTPKLLKYLDEKDLQATFFVVGSRVIQYPDTLRDEYMSGHEISVHTWSHPALTTLTTEQVVAELGWTRLAIQKVLGVTPTTMRPPYGDIDDRVRAIALAMGMVPIIWTRGPQNNQFDTNDWRVPGGLVTGPQSVQTFNWILGNATEIDTGFIVLEHDLFEQTVDLAVGYTLDLALNYSPKLTLEPIGQCQHWPNTELYLETTTNTTFPYLGTEASNDASSTASARAAAASSAGVAASSNSKSGAMMGLSMPAFGQILAAVSVLVGGLLVA